MTFRRHGLTLHSGSISNKLDFCYSSKGSLNTLTAQREQGFIVTLGYLSEVEPRDGQTYRQREVPRIFQKGRNEEPPEIPSPFVRDT